MTSKKEKFEWTEEGLAAFHNMKEMLIPTMKNNSS